jgi:hypothetical protein
VLLSASLFFLLDAGDDEYEPRATTGSDELTGNRGEPGELEALPAGASTTDPIDCPDSRARQDRRRSREQMDEELAMAAAGLRDSTDIEHQLVAAMILASHEPAAALGIFRRAAKMSGAKEIAAWRMLILCGQRKMDACDDPEIEDIAIAADGGNALMWTQLAGRRLQAGREQDAIEAMRQAITAPMLDVYLGEQVDLFDHGLAAISSWSYTERVSQASSYISSAPENLGFIRQQCGETGTGVWMELCEQLGARLLAADIDDNIKRMGAALRQPVLQQLDDTAGLAELEAELALMKAQDSSFLNEEADLNLMLNDASVMRAYINNVDAYGEQEAARRFRQDSDRLRNTPGYDQCNFVSNPYIIF